MYQRFRVWVDSDLVDTRNADSFSVPPPPPSSASVERVHQPQHTETSPVDNGNTNANGRSDEFEAGIEGVYIISVAARILDMHPQTLRKYERLGLINPGRTVGMLRLYSREDIRKVFLIRHLMEHLGLNLAGVEFALNLVENLQGFKQYLKTVSEGTEVEPIVEPAMAQLFRNLNLPDDEG